MSAKRVIMDVRGAGEARAKQLKDLGISSVEALAASTEATLLSIRGVSPRIAAELTAAALALLHTPLPNVTSQTVSDPSDDKIALPKQLPVTKPKVKKDKDAGAAKSKKKDRKNEKKTTKKAAKAVADKVSKKAEKKSKKEAKTNKGDEKLAKKGKKVKKSKK
jgi:hypothetical protein